MYSRSASFYFLLRQFKTTRPDVDIDAVMMLAAYFNLHIVVLLKTSDQVQSSLDGVLSLDDAVRYALLPVFLF